MYSCIVHIIIYVCIFQNQKPETSSQRLSRFTQCKGKKRHKKTICPDIHCGPHAP